MKLLATRIAGFGPHTDTAIKWTDHNRLTAVVASNGTGKTFLMEADFACLYGTFPSYGGSLFDALTEGGDGKGVLETMFEQHGETYTAVREVSRTAKTTRQVATLSNADGTILAGPKVSDFENGVEALLGPASAALASWFACQGAAGDLVSLSTADRRAVFSQLLELEKLDAISEKAKLKRGEVQVQIQILEAKLAGTNDPEENLASVRQLIKDIGPRRKTAVHAVETAERTLAGLEQQAAAVQRRAELQRDLERVRMQLESANRALATSQSQRQEITIPELTFEETVLAQEVNARKAAFTKARAQVADLQRQATVLSTEIRSAERTLSAAPPPALSVPPAGDACAPCPLWQEIHTRLDMHARMTTELANLRTSLETLQPQVAAAEAYDQELLAEATKAEEAAVKAVSVRSAQDRAEALDQAIVAQRSNVEALEGLRANSQAAFDALPESSVTQRDIERARMAVDTAKLVVSGLDTEQGRLAQEETHLLRVIDEQAINREELERLRAKTERLNVLVKAFGRQGVQALLVDRASVGIEDEANRLLADMAEGRFRLQISTQSETRDGRLREDLDVLVTTPAGTLSVSRLSGGERRLIQTCLRIAVTIWSARHAGRPTGTLRIDEAFDALDDDRARELIQSLQQLDNVFDQIIVITHNTNLAALFPHRIGLPIVT